MPKTIVADASCLIALGNIGELEILKLLYGEVVTTTEVAREFGEGLPEWFSLQDPGNKNIILLLETMLDRGEASAIALCLEINSPLLIIDEKKGRRIAKGLGIALTGVCGILLKAKSQGIIAQVTPLLNSLEQAGFRISQSLRQSVLYLAGEHGK